MLTKSNYFQVLYILAVPFLIWNLSSCLQTILVISAGFTFLQMALPVGMIGVILITIGYLKCKKELSLGLILAGLILVSEALLRIFSHSSCVQVILYGTVCLFLFLIGQYLYQNILIQQKFTKKTVQSFMKNILICLFIVFAILKIISFTLKSITVDTWQDEQSDVYVDFIKGYQAIHPESEKPRFDAYFAWQKMMTENSLFYSRYFLNLSVCGFISVVSIYLGCTISSPVIACACILIGMIVYTHQMGMSGIVLQYGNMIQTKFILVALLFLLRYLYRQSKKQ